MNRFGAGKQHLGGSASNIIIMDDDEPPKPLYGIHHLDRINGTNVEEECLVISGIQLATFAAFLGTHFPNHWAAKAVFEAEDVITGDMLRDVSNEIHLGLQDANYLRDFQNWADKQPGRYDK